jgi:hypothetical protein
MLLVAAALTCVPVAGQAEECVTFRAVPENAALTVRASIVTSSRSPMEYCDAVSGREYLLNVYAHGYEDRTLKFRLSGGTLELKGDRLPYVLRSVVIPGSGLWAKGHRGRGTWLFTLNALGVWNMISTYVDYDAAKDETARLLAAADLVQTVPEVEALRERALAADLEADALQNAFVASTVLAGWVYAGNLVEAFLIAAPPSVRSIEGSSAIVSTPRKSSRRAFWRSLFFPGVGQNYLGNNFRSFLFQAGFLASAAYAIEANLDYDRADNRYRLALIDLEEAQTVPEKEAALAQLGAASDERRDNETKRDVMLVITGSVWLLSVIDAAFSETPQEAAGTSIGFETSYRHSTLRTGLRVKF